MHGHLNVKFIIRIYHDARSPERQIYYKNLSRCTVTWTSNYAILSSVWLTTLLCPVPLQTLLDRVLITQQRDILLDLQMQSDICRGMTTHINLICARMAYGRQSQVKEPGY